MHDSCRLACWVSVRRPADTVALANIEHALGMRLSLWMKGMGLRAHFGKVHYASKRSHSTNMALQGRSTGREHERIRTGEYLARYGRGES